MTVTAASFRQAYPAFTDDTVFPTSMLSYQIGFAMKMHNTDRWGDFLDDGIMLYVAHMITLEQQSQAATAVGQAPGVINAPLSSASVDGASYSRNAGAVSLEGAGHFNLTSYGLRWKQMANIVGAGGIQIGSPDPSDSTVGAWPGPMPVGW